MQSISSSLPETIEFQNLLTPTTTSIVNLSLDRNELMKLTMFQTPWYGNFLARVGDLFSDLYQGAKHCVIVSSNLLGSLIPSYDILRGFVNKFVNFSKVAVPVGLGLTCCAFAMYVAYRILKLNARKYKRFDSNHGGGALHRPTIPNAALANALNVNPISYSVDQFPPEKKEQAEKLIRENREAALEMRLIPVSKCSCGHNYSMCQCPNFMAREQAAIKAAELQTKICKNNALLNELEQMDLFIFNTGVKLRFKADKTNLGFLRHFMGKMEVTYEICDTFNVSDTRPSTEKHILVSNSVFYVLRCTRVRSIYRFLTYKTVIEHSPNILWSLGFVGRDLVVAEDHMKLSRRASLSDNFARAFKSQLECSMGVPINDPSFYSQNVNVMADAFNFLIMRHTGVCSPYQKVFQ